jgi:UDP-galactopyranose mutase
MDSQRGKKYDVLVVGAGPFGATVAREVTDAGKRALVIERRPVIGGNCHSSTIDGIEVHTHGPHLFHMDSGRIWDYVRRFTGIIPYQHRARLFHEGRFYSFPVNLFTLNQLYGIKTPQEAEEHFASVSIPRPPGSKDLESLWLNRIGAELYNRFILGYTKKAWGRDPRTLPELISKRIPVSVDLNDDYSRSAYQGIPDGSWTSMVERMLYGIEVRTGVDFFADRAYWESQANRIVYSGSLDELFGCDRGRLEYRSIKLIVERHEKTVQGCATVNYPDMDVPWVRITEYKFFPPYPSVQNSVIMKEVPEEFDGTNERYYPINTEKNTALATEYRARAEAMGYLVGGRLADYRYYDIQQVIAQALTVAKSLIEGAQGAPLARV